MALPTRKRGQAAAGGGGGGWAAALLGALGLGSFARLDLPAPHDGLDIAASVDHASGRIVVSLGDARVTAAPADLAAAHSLPLGPVVLSPEVDAAVFSSAEAIAIVRGFIHDRFLMGGGGDGWALPEDVIAALRLVEEGKAHEVDWGRLFWEVVTGEPRHHASHLLRLMVCQRPDLFSVVDSKLHLRMRRKGLMLQQCERTGGPFVGCSVEVVEESLLRGNSSNDQSSIDDSSFLSLLRTMDEREDSSSEPASFHDCVQRIRASVPNMETAVFQKEQALMDTRAELQHMMEMLKEKANVIAYIKEDIKEELQARHAIVRPLEHDMRTMFCTLQQYQKLFQKSAAAFLEYKNMILRGEIGEPSSDVFGLADVQNHRMRQLRIKWHQDINVFQRCWLVKYSQCVEQITGLAARLTYLNNEVQRLKDSISIPDLNIGTPEL